METANAIIETIMSNATITHISMMMLSDTLFKSIPDASPDNSLKKSAILKFLLSLFYILSYNLF